jgi:uncharacterized membrane protein (UPF0127 family)
MTAMNPSRTLEPQRAVRALAFVAALILAAALGAGVAGAQTGPIEDLASFPRDKLEIADERGSGKKAKHVFEVWLADSPSRQAQGLMFVRDLPDLRGMLFVHEQPREITMWMKNTYIPLDMVFINDHGRIQQIIEQATPHSLAIIRSDKPALAVLEIAGGEAHRLGLHAGQRVTHPALVSH